jgi:hypothetical protein
MQKSPAFIELRRIEAARDIADRLANSRNKVYLDAETLLLNLTNKLDENLEKGEKGNVLNRYQKPLLLGEGEVLK